MSIDVNDGQMIFWDLEGLKFPDICLTGEEKPRKTSPRKLVPTGDRTRARMLPLAPQRWTKRKYPKYGFLGKGSKAVVDLRYVKEPQAEIRASEQNLSDFSRSL